MFCHQLEIQNIQRSKQRMNGLIAEPESSCKYVCVYRTVHIQTHSSTSRSLCLVMTDVETCTLAVPHV